MKEKCNKELKMHFYTIIKHESNLIQGPKVFLHVHLNNNGKLRVSKISSMYQKYAIGFNLLPTSKDAPDQYSWILHSVYLVHI